MAGKKLMSLINMKSIQKVSAFLVPASLFAWDQKQYFKIPWPKFFKKPWLSPENKKLPWPLSNEEVAPEDYRFPHGIVDYERVKYFMTVQEFRQHKKMYKKRDDEPVDREEFISNFNPGLYKCRVCNEELFESDHKFHNNHSQVTFWGCIEDKVHQHHVTKDNGDIITEAQCKKCNTYIGY